MKITKKCIAVFVLFCMMVSLLDGCNFKRIVPVDGQWYCAKLDILLDFSDVCNTTVNGEYGYQISGERKSNVVYLRTRPGYKAVFDGLCIRNDGTTIEIVEEKTQEKYYFVRQDIPMD